MKPINTVNVLFTEGGNPTSIVSFPDTPEGNLDAEKEFIETIKRNDKTFKDDDIEGACENGYWEIKDDSVYIIHSD